ncbi:hypothetical protein ACVWY0_001224 [Arthrobacter sp. UYNi723]
MNQNGSRKAARRPVRGYADSTGNRHHHEALTREQLQALGQRRKDAEQKLERHQLEARSKEQGARSKEQGARSKEQGARKVFTKHARTLQIRRTTAASC